MLKSNGVGTLPHARRHARVMETFTFDRNTYRESAERSAEFLARHIDLVRTRVKLTKIESNVIGGFASSVGIFTREGDEHRPTRLAEAYLRLYRTDPVDAWQWLATRTLWRFIVPNGTASAVNAEAKVRGLSFSFFSTLLGVLKLLESRPDGDRYLYYDELCAVLADDDHWHLKAHGFYQEVMKVRGADYRPLGAKPGLLGELEDRYSIGRDNWNGMLGKLFQQTGLFEYARNEGKVVGIALSSALDDRAIGRVKFVLDHPAVWDETKESWSDFLDLHDPDMPQGVYVPEQVPAPQALQELVPAASATFDAAGLLLDPALVRRFSASLLAKRFVILTGLSGSGKTQLARAFAAWITPTAEDAAPGPAYEVISVGADWTSNENILGYPDALDRSKYVRTQALDLLLRAREYPEAPHFLILDEMNLSHVERYFADLLSTIESGEPIRLYSDADEERGGVPPSMELPPNLFAIGTVNVDETTYMFSPKVLDRANVIEFRVEPAQMAAFLDDPKGVRKQQLAGRGVHFGGEFARAALMPAEPGPTERERLKHEVLLFFDQLSVFGSEFGFRTANEIARFLFSHRSLTEGEWSFDDAMDAQVVQKLLPKLHGSRKKLEAVLCALAALCFYGREGQGNAAWTAGNRQQLKEKVAEVASLTEPTLHPLARDEQGAYLWPKREAHYPLSYDKLLRMLRLLEENGFASFAEA